MDPTTSTAPLHSVLGATGGTGSALLTELAARGIPSRAVVRRPAGRPLPASQVRTADTSDVDQLTEALAGSTVVHHAAQPAYTRWAEELPAMNAAVLEATRRVGARLVVADNLYCYGPGASPMSENSPHRAADRKGALRSRLAADLLAAHAAGRVPVTIGRSSDHHGPHGHRSCLGLPAMSALLTGSGPVQWIGSLDTPHTIHFLADVARALVTLATTDVAYGRAWHLPAAEPLTARDFFTRAAAVAGVEPRFEVLDGAAARAVGARVPEVAELAEIAYQWEAPFTTDSSAYERHVAPAVVTDHDSAIAVTVEHYTHLLRRR